MEEKPIYEGTIRVSCIAIGAKQAYVLRFLDYDNYNAAIEQWLAAVNNITVDNVALYVFTYRGILGIPFDIELDDERELIRSRFGDMPIENKEFVDLMEAAKVKYEKERKHYPEFIQWVTENFDCEYELVPGIFHFEN